MGDVREGHRWDVRIQFFAVARLRTPRKIHGQGNGYRPEPNVHEAFHQFLHVIELFARVSLRHKSEQRPRCKKDKKIDDHSHRLRHVHPHSPFPFNRAAKEF